jgi:hypothetical protein
VGRSISQQAIALLGMDAILSGALMIAVGLFTASTIIKRSWCLVSCWWERLLPTDEEAEQSWWMRSEAQ